MNTKVCPKCGKENSAQMSFCSNCGQPLDAPAGTTPSFSDDPPPTVMMGQSLPKPGESPFGGSSNPPSNPFTPPSSSSPNSPFNQSPQSAPFTPNAPNQSFQPASTPPQPPQKSNKGLIFGAVGCIGLLVVSLLGAGIVGLVFKDDLFGSKPSYASPSPFTSNSTTTKSSPTTSDSPTTPSSDAAGLLLTILESRKEVGDYKQTDAKTVVTTDYFPKGLGAAQATYSSSGKFVFLTVGKFASMTDTKANFDDQIRGVKGNGGKVTYQNTASDGTISAIYEKGGYFFAEYCNTNFYCNRIHSNNRDALRAFFAEYAK